MSSGSLIPANLIAQSWLIERRSISNNETDHRFSIRRDPRGAAAVSRFTDLRLHPASHLECGGNRQLPRFRWLVWNGCCV